MNDHSELEGQRLTTALRGLADGLDVPPYSAAEAARASIASGRRLRRRRAAGAAAAGTCLIAGSAFIGSSLLSGQTATTVPPASSATATESTRATELAAGITAQEWLTTLPPGEARFWLVPGSNPVTVNWDGRQYQFPENTTPSWGGLSPQGVVVLLNRNDTGSAPSPADVKILLADGTQKTLATGLAPGSLTLTDAALFSWNKASQDDAITATRIDLATGSRNTSVTKSPGDLIGVSDRGFFTQQGGTITRTASGTTSSIGSRVPDRDTNPASDLTAFIVVDPENRSCRVVVDADGQSMGKPLCTPLPDGARSFVSPGGVWVIEDGYLVHTSTGARFRMAPQAATAGQDLAWSWESTNPDIAYTEIGDTTRVECRLSTGTCTKVTFPG